MAYKKDVDYSDLIDQAVAQGNYKAAAQYEQQRNAKIKGEGLNYDTTNRFSGWLDDTDYGELGLAQMAAGASKDDVRQTYYNRLNKASGTEGMSQYTNDDIMQQMLAYINTPDKSPVISGVQTQQGTTTTPQFSAEAYETENPKPTFNIQDYLASNPMPSYESQYGDRIDALLNELLNREAFSYDAENDPLFQQYRNQYSREGSRAINDTMAAAASFAGGMNSYAMTAAQQAGDYYNSQLMDKLPELAQIAYEMYLTDIDSKVRDIGLLQDMDEQQYNRYRDTMSDWRSDRDFAYGTYRDDMGDWQTDRDFSYGVHRDDVADSQWQQSFDYNAERDAIEDERYEREWQYQLDRDAIADERYDSEWEYNVGRDALADQRYDQEYADSLSQWERQFAAKQNGSAADTETADEESTYKVSDIVDLVKNGIIDEDTAKQLLGFGTGTEEPVPTDEPAADNSMLYNQLLTSFRTMQASYSKDMLREVLVSVMDQLSDEQVANLMEIYGL